MKINFIPLFGLGLLSFCGCSFVGIHGSGVAKTETRSVASFSKIDLSGSPDVEVTIGSPQSVSITADDNLLPIIETTVGRDTLKIDSKESYNTSIGIKVKITVAKLEGVSVSGSGNIHAEGLAAGDMDASVTGSGDVFLKGAVNQLSAQVTGSGELQAGDLTAKSVHVGVTGSGDATVHASEELEASVTGSGDVKYSGHPAKVQKRVTGSGNIAQR
jgi:hypothetical protein